MRKIKRIYKADVVRASITVETALVMPLILACIMLVIIMNGYLHDMVVLNGIAVEVLYSEAEEKEQIFYEEAEQRALWLKNIDFSESEDMFEKTISWQKNYFLPVGGLLSVIIDEEKIELAGDVQKQAWSMPQIIRYMNQN